MDELHSPNITIMGPSAATKAALNEKPKAVIAAVISTPRAAIAAFNSAIDAKNVASPTISAKIKDTVSKISTTLS